MAGTAASAAALITGNAESGVEVGWRLNDWWTGLKEETKKAVFHAKAEIVRGKRGPADIRDNLGDICYDMSKTAIADAVAEAQRKAKIAINAAKGASAHHAARAAAEAPAAEAPGAGAGTAGPGSSSLFSLPWMFTGSRKANNYKCSTCGQTRRGSAPAAVLHSAAPPSSVPSAANRLRRFTSYVTGVKSREIADLSFGDKILYVISQLEGIQSAKGFKGSKQFTNVLRYLISHRDSFITGPTKASKSDLITLNEELVKNNTGLTNELLNIIIPAIRTELATMGGGYNTRRNKKSKKSLTRKRH